MAEARRPAVPDYVRGNFMDAPPGHRFALYLKAWDKGFAPVKDEKRAALDEVVRMGPYGSELLRALRERQLRVAEALRASAVHLRAESTSPLIVGTGIEHPLEIGFAFLNPYGVPYVPGSAVKGMLRRAAEELALGVWGDRRGWDVVVVWWLFGFDARSAYLAGPSAKMAADVPRAEAAGRWERWRTALSAGDFDKELADAFVRRVINPSIEARTSGLEQWGSSDPVAVLGALLGADGDRSRADRLRAQIQYQGALRFWDALIEPAQQTLGLDVVNPHLGDYYRDAKTPADCGKPVPSFFLVVPPGSRFDFVVQVAGNRLPEQLARRWQDRVEAAFSLAFDWLGFGAKGAVGYGRMRAAAGARVSAGTPPMRDSEFEARMAQIRALPGGGRAAGQVSPFVEWCLSLEDPEQRRQAAGALVARMGHRWVAAKAKQDPRWRTVFQLATGDEKGQR